jgi:hypothetical protein
MRFAVAGTSWHRLIGCPRVDRPTVRALAIFAMRYQGQGPDPDP